MSDTDWPQTTGNVWMLERRGDLFRYMSDQYQGRLMGFEQRDRVILAQTGPLALGAVGMGPFEAVPRDLPEHFGYHVLDATLGSGGVVSGARSSAIISELYAAAAHRAHGSWLALSGVGRGGAYQQDVLSTILSDLRTGRDRFRVWGKSLFVDRVAIDLFSARPDMLMEEAMAGYLEFIRQTRNEITQVTGQASFPIFTINQSGGTRFDGRHQPALAEGRLNLDNPSLGIVVVTPSYPFDLMDDMPATPSAEAATRMDELQVLAIDAVQNGGRWQCPLMTYAELREQEIVVEFVADSDLVLEDGFHGFSLDGPGRLPEIVAVAVDGATVRLSLSEPPISGDLFLTYAWGAVGDGTLNRCANSGAIRDSWERQSIVRPDTALHRYALSARVKVVSP